MEGVAAGPNYRLSVVMGPIPHDCATDEIGSRKPGAQNVANSALRAKFPMIRGSQRIMKNAPTRNQQLTAIFEGAEWSFATTCDPPLFCYDGRAAVRRAAAG